jgi:hypothetical protein
MTDAPERIWRVAPYIPQHFNHGLASWADKNHAGEGATEYIRADLAKPKVKPLVWVELRNHALGAGPYQIRYTQPGVYSIAFHGKIVCKSIKGIELAKQWVQDHNAARILEALE